MFEEWMKEAERLSDAAIHAYAAWLAEFTTGDLPSLHVERLNDEKDAARAALLAHIAARPQEQEALTKDEIDAVIRALSLDHDGSYFEAECPACTAYRKLAAQQGGMQQPEIPHLASASGGDASKTALPLPPGTTLALSLAIQALEAEPPMGKDWPVNWPLVVHGLKGIKAALESTEKPNANR